MILPQWRQGRCRIPGDEIEVESQDVDTQRGDEVEAAPLDRKRRRNGGAGQEEVEARTQLNKVVDAGRGGEVEAAPLLGKGRTARGRAVQRRTRTQVEAGS